MENISDFLSRGLHSRTTTFASVIRRKTKCEITAVYSTFIPLKGASNRTVIPTCSEPITSLNQIQFDLFKKKVMSCKFDLKSQFSQMIILRVFVPFCFYIELLHVSWRLFTDTWGHCSFYRRKDSMLHIIFITAVFLVYDFNDIQRKMSCKMFNYLNWSVIISIK